MSTDKATNATPQALGSTEGLGQPQRITHVAVRYAGKVWSLPAPNRHHNVLRMIVAETGDGIRGPDEQGFLDESGRFLRRAQAYLVACRTGQINRRPGGYQGTDLYSEDLW